MGKTKLNAGRKEVESGKGHGDTEGEILLVGHDLVVTQINGNGLN